MTSSNPICLDVTRLITRVGRGPWTGIDRVVYAWLDGLIERPGDHSGLVRTASGYSWLDRPGLVALRDRLLGRQEFGAPDTLSRLSRNFTPARRQAEADARRLARASCLRPGLGGLLKTHMPRDSVYLNLGHNNLDAHFLASIGAVAQIVVMLHDVIPLDLPRTQRPDTASAFRKRVAAIAKHAELIICPSWSAAADVRRHLPHAPVFVSPPGVSLTEPDPPGLGTPDGPFFLSVGTIDMRKNQAILLDVWEGLGPSAPPLVLAGTVGWCDAALAERLDHLPSNVTVQQGLSDGAIAGLMTRSRGLLHAALAEGYGFPPIEASLRGVPVVCSDLPVFHETLSDIPIYANSTDSYQWRHAVERLMNASRHNEEEQNRPEGRLDRPTWDDHLNLVLSRLWD